MSKDRHFFHQTYPRMLRLSVLLLCAALAACQSAGGLKAEKSKAAPSGPTLSPLSGQPPQPQASTPPRVESFPLREDSNMVGEVRTLTSNFKDTLLDIGQITGLGYHEITAANPSVDPWLPGDGTRVVLSNRYVLPDAPRRGVVLNLAQMRLFYFPPPRNGEPPTVVTYPVGIGVVKYPTPLGRSVITDKVKNPTWHVPGSVLREHAAKGDPLPAVMPPGPDNPLGTHTLRLGSTSYLIHGTNRPSSIGMRVTHGCIQLYPEDIRAFFDGVPSGTELLVVNQPYLLGRDNGALYLQAFKPLEEFAKDWHGNESVMNALRAGLGKLGMEESAIDWTKAQQVAQAGRGFPVPVSPRSSEIDDIMTAAPLYGAPLTKERPAQAKPVKVRNVVTSIKGREQWYLHVGRFQGEKNAQTFAATLSQINGPIPVEGVRSARDTHTVLAGPFASRGEADRTATRIKKSFGAECTAVKSEGKSI
jgi:L,D-transpeptidase ErfK/SrfK